jgi:hypothetical protein
MGIVLGLHGEALSGKDSVGDILVKEFGWDGKLAFAHNLKEMCKAIFYLTDYEVGDQEGKKKAFATPKTFTERNLGSVMYWMSLTHRNHRIDPENHAKVKSLVGTPLETPRRILQFVGTDICRTLVTSYHVDIVTKVIQDNPDKNFVITDVRFPDEGDLILDSLGGKVVEVTRPGRPDNGVDRGHASETAMKSWGRFSDVLVNDKDGLEFLKEKVNQLIGRQNLCLEETM